ncbi:hypothetical protein SPRG_01117 [Saprolegnia parasitica CBS 223.65]|uniref:Borealin N-terminal domain-containing protein n=1 Tax=Saprolegnia parasitica (strain CBS 223.65) TaxID=695850 RepID=A0A067CX15_SAPPC|nr:hypothetical protein SPRG_01117 [Saprolegnia parasitica CBS 223.65]KDO35053.1 hypothetical protein SPRG_01117 [Saprolegnia parasitica CBS 223.65]|eukprot:XP_012194706.1 hypothetical protein SPRG_01117 [Saprolegnia parasitica CBS 223.65]
MDRKTLLETKLRELDEQVEERCRKMQKLVDTHVAAMKTEFARDLMTLPENILNMPLDEFMQKYNGSLDSAGPTSERRSSLRIRNMSISKYSTPSKPVEIETPSRRRSLRTPSTVRRRQEGEITYSARGSPIDPDDMGIKGKPKLFVMLDEKDMTHMNLRLVDDKTNTETEVDFSSADALDKLRKEGKEDLAILHVKQYKQRMQAYCDEIMAKLAEGAS